MNLIVINIEILAETSGKGGRAGGGFKAGGRGTGRNMKPNVGNYRPQNNPNVYRSQFSGSRGGMRYFISNQLFNQDNLKIREKQTINHF